MKPTTRDTKAVLPAEFPHPKRLFFCYYYLDCYYFRTSFEILCKGAAVTWAFVSSGAEAAGSSNGSGADLFIRRVVVVFVYVFCLLVGFRVLGFRF